VRDPKDQLREEAFVEFRSIENVDSLSDEELIRLNALIANLLDDEKAS
jgi:hypothetical protein